MRFDYTVINSLPPLSWLAVLEEGSSLVRVIVGNAVETFDDFFVSGVWDGDFEQGDFENCDFACCTGARISAGSEQVVFLTPHHLNACIFSVRQNSSLILSNSASFTLAYSGEKLDPNYFEYDKDMCCELLAERNMKPPYHSSIPLLKKSRLNIYSFCKIFIDKSLNVKLERRSSKFHFSNYSDYRRAISLTLEKLSLNVKSEKRKCEYGMMATISRGYDAPTCATLVREIGCDEVFTFNRPAKYKNDCGTELAQILGYKTIYECDGDLVKSNTEYIEAADFASGDTGSMVTFEGHKDLFANKLLFCGFRGDEYWAIDHEPNDDMLCLTETSSENSYEVFLQSNTILIMIPCIGADHATQIFDISMSDEMKPWRLGVRYDRPICRRIVEEAGIGREMFGQKKVGSGYCFHYDTMKSIGKKLSPQSYKSLMDFSKGLKQNPFKKLLAYSRYLYYNIPIFLPYLLYKFHININMKMWTKEHLSNPVSTTYILWGMDYMSKLYKKALDEGGKNQ